MLNIKIMNQESPPFITIIVAVFNGQKTLQQCINSISQQTYLNKELIIVDGGSTDGSVDLLVANQENISYWISEPDKGIYNAWNKGLSQAKGDWICFLGADDYFWDGQVLGQVVNQLQKLPSEIRVAYGKIMLVDANRQSLFAIGEPWGKIKKRFKQLMCIPHPGAMHHKSLFAEVGHYDETFRIAADYELLLRELKNNDAFYIPNLISVGMMQGGISSDPVNSLLCMKEIRHAQKINGLGGPGCVWLMAIARMYVRFLLWRLLGEGLTLKIADLYRSIMKKTHASE